MKICNSKFIFNGYSSIIYGIILLIASFFISCKSPESLSYFQNINKDTSISKLINNNYEIKIKKNDILSIIITSLSSEASLPYNTPSAAVNSSGTSVAASGYTVDKDGNIYMFKLGLVHVEGLTKFELKNLLEKNLTPYLKDPIVVVRFINQKVTILGEVAHPLVIPILHEGITLLDALATTGGIPQTGRTDNVLIIRELDSIRIFHHVNLKNSSIFTSPYYHLKPDDVVYVEAKKVKELLSQNTAQLISIGLSTLSILIIILRGFK